MVRAAVRQLRQAHNTLRQTEQVYMVVVAIVIGILGGLSSVAFRLLIGGLNEIFWRQRDYSLDYIYGLPIWWKVGVPAIGGLIVGFITYKFAREAKGHGVPEVMEAVALKNGRIRPRVVVGRMVASGICIASGGSVGREGPIVQIGAAIGSTIGQWLKIDAQRLRTLVGCGAAAGIAGTFNAPVAGALFAAEIILGDFGVAQFSPIVISSVAATVVSQSFLGDFPAFQVPGYSLVHANELFAYAALGILAGLVALAFVRTLYGFEDLLDKIRIYPPLKALAGGAIIGIIGIWAPHIFGVGYEAIGEALNGNMVWKFMLVLVALKILAVSITIGSGGSGGIFAPSLFIGAMLGGAVGTVVHNIWPLATAGPGAYALVGMGAVVAAATHAPITAILIIFELTADYKIMLPLMISCIIATLLATKLQASSIYTLKLLRRGVDIRKGKALNVLQHVTVREQMRADFASVAAGDGLLPLLSKFLDHPGSTLLVLDQERCLLGLISANEIRPVMADASSLDSLVIAQDVMVEGNFPTLKPTDSLAQVMKLLGGYRGEIPVIEDEKVVGVIWPEDVIKCYNTEIFKRDMAHSMASTVSGDSKVESLPSDQNTVVAEVPAPSHFAGKTIRELDIRQQFGVSIVMIKHPTGDGNERLNAAPAADYVFAEGDLMLVMGPTEELEYLKRGLPRSDR